MMLKIVLYGDFIYDVKTSKMASPDRLEYAFVSRLARSDICKTPMIISFSMSPTYYFTTSFSSH